MLRAGDVARDGSARRGTGRRRRGARQRDTVSARSGRAAEAEFRAPVGRGPRRQVLQAGCPPRELFAISVPDRADAEEHLHGVRVRERRPSGQHGGAPEAPLPTWMGWSNGGWDGETLVVDVTGLNGCRGWIALETSQRQRERRRAYTCTTRTIFCTRRRSRTRPCSRAPGRSAYRSTGESKRTHSSWRSVHRVRRRETLRRVSKGRPSERRLPVNRKSRRRFRLWGRPCCLHPGRQCSASHGRQNRRRLDRHRRRHGAIPTSRECGRARNGGAYHCSAPRASARATR